ncbi:Formate hydrogenlyase transcriptional activator [Labilithrix luteola]|uniref:Formate hydrogenlyase transcriptional activator n=1 Tax=Labilithrix luteola TaxID=1391654 RepID=A0A0K1PZB0_9BACT|nr:sigma-54 dependent transcriptional regulator [Labilithrix luteola]AKU98711.1 Formate hydrogenlyase transcriptional activator [Labilithrix luteola]
MHDRPSSICIVDDDVLAREAIVGLVRSAGLEAEAFGSAREFLARRSGKPPRCLILDVDMPELSGLALQKKLASDEIDVSIIFVTGHGNIPMSVQAIKAGAVDFFTKPLDADALLGAVETALAKRGSAARPSGPDAMVAAYTGAAPCDQGIVGASSVLRNVLHHLETVAVTDSTVLVRGETGTGKELVARAIHERSRRKRGPFVKVNCAAIPAGLLESELFGHEKGAFTGAFSRRVGRFEQANGGTIFLDEIGEMPLDLQPKLLRVLQEREFERLGSHQTVRSDVRVVAATNRDLRAMAENRLFREDLYYRLNVFPLCLPPLRERKQDIPLLAQHFLGRFAAQMNKPLQAISPETMASLTEYHWPGNIRELQNVIERAVILSLGSTFELPEALGQAPPGAASSAPTSSSASMTSAPQGPSSSDELTEFTRAHIARVLESTGWVVGGPNGAARRLGMNRSTLNFRMRKLGLVRP